MDKFPIVFPTNTIKECLEIIDRHAKRISFVIDNNILVGVVTDGDIRRGLLNNSVLQDSVCSVMNTNFVSFPIGTDSKLIRERFSKRVRHIPLIDNSGVLVDVADPRGNFRISVLEPSLKGNELNYVTECIETNWISSQGKYVSKFEKKFEEFHPETYALAVSNGTVALHLSLVALGIGPGDEVVVPDLTFAASANAVIHAGASPIFCEVDPRTWCIDPGKIKDLIGPKTKAIMPVHLYGQPCNMDELIEICNHYDLFMIEDVAEALGSEWKGKRLGTFGDAATFSFFGNKTISTGEGGMILFKNLETARRASVLRDHGMSKDKRYWHETIGYNYRLTNIQAAIGVAQMERFHDILKKKLMISNFYNNALSNVDGIIETPSKVEGTLHSNWLYGILLDEKINKNSVIEELLLNGIETRPFFYPLHSMPPYQNYNKSNSLINSNKLGRLGLSLPTSTNLSEDNLIFITEKIIQILSRICEDT